MSSHELRGTPVFEFYVKFKTYISVHICHITDSFHSHLDRCFTYVRMDSLLTYNNFLINKRIHLKDASLHSRLILEISLTPFKSLAPNLRYTYYLNIEIRHIHCKLEIIVKML